MNVHSWIITCKKEPHRANSGSVVLMAVTVETAGFWVLTPSSSEKFPNYTALQPRRSHFSETVLFMNIETYLCVIIRLFWCK
jgi:hypothetical protein